VTKVSVCASLATILSITVWLPATVIANDRLTMRQVSCRIQWKELYNAIQLIGGDPHPIDPNFVPKGARFTFGEPHRVPVSIMQRSISVLIWTSMQKECSTNTTRKLHRQSLTSLFESDGSFNNWVITPEGGGKSFSCKDVVRAAFTYLMTGMRRSTRPLMKSIFLIK